MKFAIIQFPGSNNDLDMYHAVENTLGEEAEIVSSQSDSLEGYDAVIIPGGASFGDYLRPGAIAVLEDILPAIKRFAEEGKLVLASGNGFQILCEAGVLPGMFLPNQSLKFISKAQKIRVVNSQTPFTNQYEKDTVITIPIAHGQGNYSCDEETLEELKENNQIVFLYEDVNPNGSLENITGIVNKSGNVLGFMAHPERAVEELIGGEGGLGIFKSMIETYKQEVHA